MKGGARYLTQRMVVGAAVIVVSTLSRRRGWAGMSGRMSSFVLAGPDRRLGGGGVGGEREEVVEASREVAFEAAQRSLLGFAFGLFAGKVLAGGGVVLGAGDRDDVQRVVELAVAAAVEPVLLALA